MKITKTRSYQITKDECAKLGIPDKNWNVVTSHGKSKHPCLIISRKDGTTRKIALPSTEISYGDYQWIRRYIRKAWND